MKDYAKEYLNELLRLDISQEDCEKTKKILTEVGDVADTLSNPLVTHEEKRNIITQIFPESIQKFMMNAVREGQIANMAELLEDYNDILIEKQGSIKALVRMVMADSILLSSICRVSASGSTSTGTSLFSVTARMVAI